jgi:hypothetical protein
MLDSFFELPKRARNFNGGQNEFFLVQTRIPLNFPGKTPQFRSIFPQVRKLRKILFYHNSAAKFYFPIVPQQKFYFTTIPQQNFYFPTIPQQKCYFPTIPQQNFYFPTIPQQK